MAMAVALVVSLGGTGTAVGSPQAVATISVPSGLNGVAVNSALNRVYVTDGAGGNVTMIDRADNSVLGAFPTGLWNPRALAVNSQTGRVYVSNFGGTPPEVAVFESTGSPVTAVSTSNLAMTLAVNETTNMVYVGSMLSSSLTVIDGATITFSTISTPGMSRSYGVAVDEIANRIYLSDPDQEDFEGGVHATGGATGAQVDVRNYSSPNAYYLEVDSGLDKLYVAMNCCPSGSIEVLDGSTLDSITTLWFAAGSPARVAVDS